MAKDKIQEYTGENIAYPLLYQSLTTPAVDHEPDMNYNRAEFMGDSILLWLVARLAYNLYPNASPIELTTHVNKRISNEFLAEQIKKVDVALHEYIIGERFARKRWCSPGVPVANHLREQELSRNTVADVHEALIYSSFINDVARKFLEVDDDSPFTDCRRLKEFQRENPTEAFVQPTDLETLNSCLENAERFVSKMMKLPPCELLEYENLPELPIATESSPAYVPPQSTKELMEFCEGYLRTLDPFLERHPRNLAGENDPTRNLEEMIDDKYSQLSEPMSPAKPRRKDMSPNTSPSKVRSQRHVEPTILASGVEVVPNTTLPVPSKENMVKTVVLRSKKAQKIPLDHDFHVQLEEKLVEMFQCEDEDLVLSYRRIWSDGGFNCEKQTFESDEIFYRKIRRALLRTKSLHQQQFASRVTRNEANLLAIENMLGYKFKNQDLLLQAFIHTSINPNLNKSHTYQRNEFLGDAALGFMTSLSLFSEYPEWEEGQMSHAKSAIVSNSYFARKLYRRFLAAGLKLEDFIVTKSEEIREGIREFQTVFNPEDDDLMYSLQINMTPRNERDGQAFIFPKILGDIYESIAAAILLDSGWNLVEMWKVMRPDLILSSEQIQILNENMLALKEIDVDKAKTNLQKFFNDC
jgi:dsRNA-specific ribonuclease